MCKQTILQNIQFFFPVGTDPFYFMSWFSYSSTKHTGKLRFYFEIEWSPLHHTFNSLLLTFFLPLLLQFTWSFLKKPIKTLPCTKRNNPKELVISLTSGNVCSKNIRSNKISVDSKINIALLLGLNVRCKEVLSILISYRITHPSSTEAVSKKAVIKSGKGCGNKRW